MIYGALILIVLSAYMIGHSVATLGKCYSPKLKVRGLVTGGFYSKLRHPIYMASMLMWVGLLLLIVPKWSWLPLLVVPIQIYRARKEEAALEASYGPVYRQYKKGTWF